ncbi:hypothetical protein BS78_02G248300 [Paspalum vaginatum]|nr:hypothetical protein BS78_02G248300 [Paspalum vaginatum]
MSLKFLRQSILSRAFSTATPSSSRPRPRSPASTTPQEGPRGTGARTTSCGEQEHGGAYCYSCRSMRTSCPASLQCGDGQEHRGVHGQQGSVSMSLALRRGMQSMA